jgi:hypothetical protein
MSDSIQNDLMDDAKLAGYLGCEVRTLRTWRNVRSMPHIRLTRKIIRYRKLDIDRWLDQSRTVIGGQ